MVVSGERRSVPAADAEILSPTVQRAQRLRLLFFTWNYFPAPAGGAERQARLQAEELVRRGHHVTVACPRTKGFESGMIGGVRVRRLFRIARRPFGRISYLLAMLAFFARNGRHFDLVHIHLANFQADVIVPLARLLRRPIYVKVACGGSEGEITRLASVARLTRWVGLRHATRVQALSHEIADELIAIGVRPDRIRRLPNGLEPSRFMPASHQEKTRLRDGLGLRMADVIVVFAGRFAQYKGLDDLLTVWRSRKRPNATLVLVGSADTHKSVGAIASGSNVLVRGWTNSIADYLRAADIFVYPSYSDGMSNAVMEALSAGLAVAASRSGATTEVIEDGINGLLFDAGDREQLDSRLSTLIGDALLRRRLGRAAASASTRFAITSVVDRLERIYAEMADPR
jgi:glycosyltransferase involved in cell wall biosynthesis